jgi:hypothetical protein
MALSNEPKPPTLCSSHYECDAVDITAFGMQSRRMLCLHCGGDPSVPAEVLYEQALIDYRARKAEYDALTPRIEAIEHELRSR